ncbi:immunoglobulin lambda-1 light chain-like [Protopterus annectens]|uniref:immunoglobulin lambda-1 light chain-like n=1 Tax=Protopterus annectens TaxID=7888 RepID=UPI001CFB2EBB|nr:immunoglobulin lambda-1 light chain-like [Protopterus annectens]
MRNTGFCTLLLSSLMIHAAILQTEFFGEKDAGQSITVPCKVTYKNNGIFWLRQHTGSKVEHLIWHRFQDKEEKYVPQEISSRFIPLFDKSEKTYFLKIKDLHIEDSATYYCSDIFSFIGFTMDVSGSVPPALFSIYPILDDTHEQTTVTIGCLVVSGDPKVSISWNMGSALQFPAVFNKKSKSFSAASYLTVGADDWNQGTPYTCSVNGNQTRTIKRKGAPQESSLGWWVAAALGAMLVLMTAAFITYLHFNKSGGKQHQLAYIAEETAAITEANIQHHVVLFCRSQQNLWERTDLWGDLAHRVEHLRHHGCTYDQVRHRVICVLKRMT